MIEENLDSKNIPGFVNFAMSFSEGMLFTQGNMIEPVVFYRKEGLVCEPLVIEIAREILGSHDIRERVMESVRQFVFEKSPDELVLVMEGFYLGNCTKLRCLSLIYSTPSGERTWLAAVGGNSTGPWREIMVSTSYFHQLYEKATYRWN